MKKITFLLALLISSIGFSQELITNGSFDNGDTDWYGNHGALEVRTDGGNSYFFANVANALDDANSWQVNLQQNITIEANKYYLVTFTAQTDTEGRTVKLGIGLNVAPWDNSGELIAVSTTSQVYTSTLQAPGSSNNNTRVFFDLAQSAGTISIDNVSIVETTAPVAPVLPSPTDAPTTPPAREAGDVISIYGEAYGAEVGLNPVTWDQGSDTVEETHAGNKVLKITNGSSDFIGFDIGNTDGFVNATEMTKFHIDFWIAGDAQVGQVFNTNLSNHAGAIGAQTSAIQINKATAPTDAQKWVSVDGDLGGGARERIAQIVMNYANAGTKLNTAYIDNLYFYKEAGGETGGGSDDFCEKVVTHFGIEAETASAVKLTIESSGTDSMKVTVESNDADPVDDLVIASATGAYALGDADTSVSGKISRELTWNGGKPGTVEYQILWSKASFGGNWQLTQSALTSVSGDASCGVASVDNNKLLGFSMYPNPASNRLNISAKETIKSADIFNVLGKRVMSVNINKTKQSIDVSNLSSGIYLVKYNVNGAVGTAKFIKQ